MIADYASTGVTVGRHAIAHCHSQLHYIYANCSVGKSPTACLDVKTRIAGCVIARQRPGTAHGFLSIEDESGIANAIIDPQLYEQHRALVTYAKFLLVEGTL